MITILNAEEEDMKSLINLARDTWNVTYKNIISQEQIDFMLDKFYDEVLIKSQMMDRNHHFLVAKIGHDLLGYSHCILDNKQCKLSKLYIHPNAQGKGIGALLLDHIKLQAKQKEMGTIELNVNRYNPAKDFYLKQGFHIIAEVDIPLDKFWLNDYIMQMEVRSNNV